MSDFTAFGDMERRGWSDPRRASGYIELFASASDQAIDSLLDAVGAEPDLKALDLCCGQGNVSQSDYAKSTSRVMDERYPADELTACGP